jgi:hypothetical protein
MKPLRNVFIGLLGIAFLSQISCKKETVNTNGQASALINGTLWESDVRIATKYDKFLLVMEKHKQIGNESVPWERMSIHYFDKNMLQQNIINADSIAVYAPWDAVSAFGSFITSQDDGDVECDAYKVIENDSTNNWVRIDRETGDYKEVWGSFGMHLYRTNTCNVSIYPDTLLITNGQFHFSL